MQGTTCADQVMLDDWYVVAYARELTPGTLLPTTLLGRNLVAWRDDEGMAHVWEDLCIHRGARLSKGWITAIQSSAPTTARATTAPAPAS
jgi:phenylpropionate dioxygenase-like ring-hydroxylating dioxygenase large terminal subunit